MTAKKTKPVAGVSPFSPAYPVIRGEFVIAGYEPDGDSVRFIPDNPSLFDHLKRLDRLRLSRKDGSVQLRFEGVDAPELHYGNAAQPFGSDARDRLLDWMGFREIEYAAGHPTKVAASTPSAVRGAILSSLVDANGRPVAYVLLDADVPDGDALAVDDVLLRKSLNSRLLGSGTAYYTVYTSMPKSHRDLFHAAARQARTANLGIWRFDASADFVLDTQESIGPDGACILPKLFRRCTDYLKAVRAGFSGELKDWIVWVSRNPGRNENDAVLILDPTTPRHSVETRLADLILQRNRHIALQGDLLNFVFVEK